MNTELIKSESSKSRAAAKYMQRHQTLCVTLDKTSDADIISWLNRQSNRSEAVRRVLKAEAIK